MKRITTWFLGILILLYAVTAYETPSQGSVEITIGNSYSAPNQGSVTIMLSESSEVSEATGRNAIETGITNALSKTSDATDKQIYTRNSAGTQSTGTFDKYVTSGNQRWVFNFITTGENYTNIGNLTPVLYVWEAENLTTSEITSQVQGVINSTIT